MQPRIVPEAHVLLLDQDIERREQLASRLRRRGFTISVITHVGEIERWPAGQVVVVDDDRFTPWWTEVGAARVVVLSGIALEKTRVYNGVPCQWIPRNSGFDALVAALRGEGF